MLYPPAWDVFVVDHWPSGAFLVVMVDSLTLCCKLSSKHSWENHSFAAQVRSLNLLICVSVGQIYIQSFICDHARMSRMIFIDAVYLVRVPAHARNYLLVLPISIHIKSSSRLLPAWHLPFIISYLFSAQSTTAWCDVCINCLWI